MLDASSWSDVGGEAGFLVGPRLFGQGARRGFGDCVKGKVGNKVTGEPGGYCGRDRRNVWGCSLAEL
jgi:hypothetical protein